MNEIVNVNVNHIVENKQPFKKQQYFEFFQDLRYKRAKVMIIDELGISVEMSLNFAEVEFSYYDDDRIILECSGPVKVNCPEGVELNNGVNN